jgi:hypothetical protein
MLDPARLPERPISPNRAQIDAFGAVGGLVVGLGLIALLEYRDRSLRTEEDVLGAFRLPVLALVPKMVGQSERRRRWRRRSYVGIGLMGLAVFVVVAWRLELIARWF